MPEIITKDWLADETRKTNELGAKFKHRQTEVFSKLQQVAQDNPTLMQVVETSPIVARVSEHQAKEKKNWEDARAQEQVFLHLAEGSKKSKIKAAYHLSVAEGMLAEGKLEDVEKYKQSLKDAGMMDQALRDDEEVRKWEQSRMELRAKVLECLQQMYAGFETWYKVVERVLVEEMESMAR